MRDSGPPAETSSLSDHVGPGALVISECSPYPVQIKTVEHTMSIQSKQMVCKIECRDANGSPITIVEWRFDSHRNSGDSPAGDVSEYRMEDGSPVFRVGGVFEHFYTGNVYFPIFQDN